MLQLSPKARWNLSRILPFGIIWAVIGAVFMLSDLLAIGDGPVPEGAIYPTWELFVFAMVSTFIGGSIVGVLEVIYGNRMFRKASLLQTIAYKFILYLVFFFVLVAIVYPIAVMIELSTGIGDPAVWQKFRVFWGSLAFWSTVVQLGFSLVLALLYAAISENLGHTVLLNFFTGRYHRPNEEERIFMFVDMTGSTLIAEQLGHVRYFDFLQRYYEDMADAIIMHRGEVYQYVGDEIVITWPIEKGVTNANCVRCFFAMQAALEKHTQRYEKVFGHIPQFKAGMHLGTVMTGEVGALKQEVVFTGDVLNTAARIQGLSKAMGDTLLVSDALIAALGWETLAEDQYLGPMELRGKNATIGVYGLANVAPEVLDNWTT